MQSKAKESPAAYRLLLISERRLAVAIASQKMHVFIYGICVYVSLCIFLAASTRAHTRTHQARGATPGLRRVT